MRRTVNLNEGWKCVKARTTDVDILEKNGEEINVPHTWNNIDGQDGGNDYFRGAYTYLKNIIAPDISPDEAVFLEFKGVNASAVAYFNGEEVATHDGGYSTFRAEITPLLKESNSLIVQVDNRVTETVYPQTADFTFYGGIYRDVNLIVTDKTHFDLTHFGGKGIKVDTEILQSEARITVTTYSNGGEVKITIYDADGKKVAQGESGKTITLKNFTAWDGVDNPYLYRAVAELYEGGELKDKVETNFGIREFYIDAQKGFFLNGRSYPLRGVCRHQDRKGLGNAITKAEHDEDMALILDSGANTVRLAHYQHDDYFYDLCDKYGLVVWAEIPYISRHMPQAHANAEEQMKELIIQQYNHPSIVVWGISNEITMFGKHKKDMLKRHRQLNDLCHKLDPDRLTVVACFAMCTPYNKVARIPDVVSWNLYLGWYTPFLWLNRVWFAWYRSLYKKYPIGLSEYGAESMPNLHSTRPRRGDNTEEYQLVYHEYMLKFIEKRPYLWATHVWNMFDFAADARNQGGEPGMNHKGLVTFDRKTKKDSFYLYKAYWSGQPFIHLCGKRFEKRTGKKLKIKVYTNQSQVELKINGEVVCKKSGSRVFEFTVPMRDKNEIVVSSGSLSDRGTVIKVKKPLAEYKLKKTDTKNWQK